MKRCLMVLTGAYHIGGGIAMANRLAIQALRDADYILDIKALTEATEHGGFAHNKIAFTLACWRAILTQKYDLIFCDHVNLAAMLAPLARLGLCRYAVQCHAIELLPEYINWEGRIGLHSASWRLGVSEHTRQIMKNQFPDLEMHLCPLALSPENSSIPETKIPKSLCFTSIAGEKCELGKRVILHVGRMSTAEQYKGQDKLIHAMLEILATCPDAQLVLVGKGDDAERIRNIARQQAPEVQRAIIMTGFVDDDTLQALYGQCYLFAMPSTGEGFGIVYLEAMRYAKACIGSRVDAARTIIQHGETGLLVDNPIDKEEVAQVIISLLADSNLTQQYGAAGLERLQKHYLYEHFRDRFHHWLDEVITS